MGQYLKKWPSLHLIDALSCPCLTDLGPVQLLFFVNGKVSTVAGIVVLYAKRVKDAAHIMTKVK